MPLVLLTLVLSLLVSPTQGAEFCVSAVDVIDLAIPGVRITIRNLVHGDVNIRRTDQRGEACFERLAAGRYSAEGDCDGFLNVRLQPIRLMPKQTLRVKMMLPFGEIFEGGVSGEAVVSGTLSASGAPLKFARVCAFVSGNSVPTTCVLTDELGEYAFSVAPGKYRARVEGTPSREWGLDLSAPGHYKNLLRFE